MKILNTSLLLLTGAENDNVYNSVLFLYTIIQTLRYQQHQKQKELRDLL